MASLFGKLSEFARSPQGKKVISQATRKAQQLANDPATRAKIDEGAARLKAQVAKRRTASTSPATDSPPTSTTYPTTPPSTTAGPDDLTAR